MGDLGKLEVVSTDLILKVSENRGMRSTVEK